MKRHTTACFSFSVNCQMDEALIKLKVLTAIEQTTFCPETVSKGLDSD